MDENTFSFSTYEGASQAYTEAQARRENEKADLLSALGSALMILTLALLPILLALAVVAWRWAL